MDQVVSEKKMFEIVVDDGRLPDHGYTISSPWAFRSGELKKYDVLKFDPWVVGQVSTEHNLACNWPF